MIGLFDPLFWLMVGPFMAIAAYCSYRVKSTFLRYQQVGVRTGMTGAQAAEAVARAGGAQVTIERVGGFLSDHYDPRTKTLRLSPDVYDGRSVASIAVAAHEAGHAIQDVRQYAFLGFRSAIVPFASAGSGMWFLFFIAGLLTGITGLAWIGVAIFMTTVVFQLVTLPVEFNASNHAKAVLVQAGIVTSPEEEQGVSKVLNAAAMTYVAAALVAMAQLLYYAMMLMNNDE